MQSGMDFGIEKCARLKRRKRNTTNVERNRTTKSRKNHNIRRKENLKYMGILKSDIVKQLE